MDRLDYRADDELEAALAQAASISPARIRALRVVSDGSGAACWHRTRPTWCRDCTRIDIEQHGEVYERAAWRLGSCVICPEHRILLEDACSRCLTGAICAFGYRYGLAQLACIVCRQPVDTRPVVQRNSTWKGEGAFGIVFTPSLASLVEHLRGDIQEALAGRQPKRSWGHLGTAEGLVLVIVTLTLCVVWTRN